MHINKFIASFPIIAIILLSEIFLGLGSIVMPSYIPIFGMLVVILFIVFCIKLHWGLYVLIFAVPLAFGRIIFYNNFAPVVLIEKQCSIDLFLIILVVVILAWLVRAGSKIEYKKRYILPVNNLILILLSMLISWNAVSLFWAPNLYLGFIQLVKLLANICIFYLFYYCIDSSDVLRRVVWTWLLLGVILCVISFLSVCGVDLPEEITKTRISGQIWSFAFELVEDINMEVEWKVHRSRGTAFSSPHKLSFMQNLIIALGLGLLLATKKEESKKRFVLITILILLVGSHLTSLSKGGTISLFAMIYFFLFFIHRLRKKLLKNSFIFISGFFVLFLLVQNEQLLSIALPRFSATAITGSSGGTRWEMWKEILTLFFKKSMGLGLGIGGSKFYLIPEVHAHSIYLSILCDMGFVGFLLFGLLTLIIVKEVLPIIKYQKTFSQNMLLASCGAMVAIAVHGLVDFHYNTTEIWMIAGVGMAALRLTKQEFAEQKQMTRNLPTSPESR